MCSSGSTYNKIGTIQRRLAWPLAQGWHANSWSVPNFLFVPRQNEDALWRLHCVLRIAMLCIRCKTRKHCCAPRGHETCFWRSLRNIFCPPQMLRAWQNESIFRKHDLVRSDAATLWTLTNGSEVKYIFPRCPPNVKSDWPLTEERKPLKSPGLGVAGWNVGTGHTVIGSRCCGHPAYDFIAY